MDLDLCPIMSEDVAPSIETVSEEKAKEIVSENEQNEVAKVAEFDWLSYLEEHGIEASPEAGFLHVENSLDSGVREGNRRIFQ